MLTVYHRKSAQAHVSIAETFDDKDQQEEGQLQLSSTPDARARERKNEVQKLKSTEEAWLTSGAQLDIAKTRTTKRTKQLHLRSKKPRQNWSAYGRGGGKINTICHAFAHHETFPMANSVQSSTVFTRAFCLFKRYTAVTIPVINKLRCIRVTLTICLAKKNRKEVETENNLPCKGCLDTTSRTIKALGLKRLARSARVPVPIPWWKRNKKQERRDEGRIYV